MERVSFITFLVIILLGIMIISLHVNAIDLYYPRGINVARGFIYVIGSAQDTARFSFVKQRVKFSTIKRKIYKYDRNGRYIAQWGVEGLRRLFAQPLGAIEMARGQINFPLDLAVDERRNVYVLDAEALTVQKFDDRGAKIATFQGRFGYPGGIAVHVEDTNVVYIYVTDDGVKKFSEQGRLLTSWGTRGAGDGQFNTPLGIDIDGNGFIYVVDTGNNRIQKLDENGGMIWQSGSRGAGDGQFNAPFDVALDDAENIYVTDTGNNRVQKLGPDGQFIKTWGGRGSLPGQFALPTGIAVYGNEIYIVDTKNHRVQKFDTNGNFLQLVVNRN
ncbi:hypothetical protein ES703_33122 [subsurface metagenome]